MDMTCIPNKTNYQPDDWPNIHELMYPGKITVTEDDLKLLAQMRLDYSAYAYDGMVTSDPKRPWGNSDYAYDVAEILGMPSDDDGEYDEDMIDNIDVAAHIARLAAVLEHARDLILRHADDVIGKEIPCPIQAHGVVVASTDRADR